MTTAKFAVGDRVLYDGYPGTLTVHEVGTCDDGPDCPLGGEVFRYDELDGGDADWVHASNARKV